MHRRRNQLTALFMLVLLASQHVAALGEAFDLSGANSSLAAEQEHCPGGQLSTDTDFFVNTGPTIGSCHEGCQHCVGNCCLFLASVELDTASTAIPSILVDYSIPVPETRADILFHPPRLA